jgi:hypothetical protein
MKISSSNQSFERWELKWAWRSFSCAPSAPSWSEGRRSAGQCRHHISGSRIRGSCGRERYSRSAWILRDDPDAHRGASGIESHRAMCAFAAPQCHFEVPNTVARVVLFGDAASVPHSGSMVEVCATAKRDLKPGEVLDDYGHYMTYGEAENSGRDAPRAFTTGRYGRGLSAEARRPEGSDIDLRRRGVASWRACGSTARRTGSDVLPSPTPIPTSAGLKSSLTQISTPGNPCSPVHKRAMRPRLDEHGCRHGALTPVWHGHHRGAASIHKHFSFFSCLSGLKRDTLLIDENYCATAAS